MAPAHSGFQALVDLARRDRVEMRPVLLRVLTDLYVQEPLHAAADRARFAELACRLLDHAELPVRAAVAERLANCPAVPHSVAIKLARDEIEVAAPILQRCAALTEDDFHAILDQGSPAHRTAIMQRADLPKSIALRLRPLERSSTPSTDLPRDENLTRALASRYIKAESQERRLIVNALRICSPAGNESKLSRIERSVCGKLERAALRHRRAEFVALMQAHTDMPRDLAQQVVDEKSGELLAVYCRALGMDFTTVSRIVLFLNPGAGRSTEQVLALADRFDAVPAEIARRLVAAWCALGKGLRPEHSRPAQARQAPIEPRSPAVRTFRGVTPARPAAANES